MICAGRTEIFTDYEEVNSSNIVKVISKAYPIHNKNSNEIEYLQKYEKGIQPILHREKKVRPEINHKVVENHASEIVSFKVGYFFGSPVAYGQREKTDDNSANTDESIGLLNEMFYEENKSSQDLRLGKDLAVCGIGYRFICPKADTNGKVSLFDLLKLNPRTTFVIKTNDIYKTPIVAVTYVKTSNNSKIKATAYTDTKVYKLEGSSLGSLKLISEKNNVIGTIPIIEYRNNDNYMGSFETVIPLLDALNDATSDRLNSLEQFVQAFLWLNNCEIEEEQMANLKDKLGLMTSSQPGNPASVQYLTATLNQSETQTLIDDLYEQVLQIAGVPGREQSTGGNTGQAIMLSNGWQIAENQARALEPIFEESERIMLEKVLKILKALAGQNKKTSSLTKLKVSDIGINFSRNRTDSLLVKTQGLLNQLTAGIHPLVAITNCGLYSDPQGVWNDSKAYMNKWLYEDEEIDNATLSEVRQSGGEDNISNKEVVSAE